MTADALSIPVYAGPVEATAIGNILTQAMAKGEISDLHELREIVRHSVTPQVYHPKNRIIMTMKHTKQSIISKDGVSYLIPFILITSCFALWGFATTLPIRW